ncbi:MAG TPA: hypothetical protein VJT73_17475, partial [Polyangiaceae bacterium]|nr:hypothetical protein [Polyangiaceae bacterium]
MRPMRTCGSALLLALACAAPALSAPRKNDKTPPAAIDRTSSKTKEVAQKVYEQGTGHFRAGRLLEALAAFRASYDMVPSPNSHLMIARTLRDRGDLAQAFAEYGKVTIEAEAAAQRDAKYAAAAEASRSERAKLKDKLTMVVVKVKS